MASTTPLHSYMNNDGPSIYYDDGFRNVLEYHIEYLKHPQRHTPVAIEPHIAYKYEHDFYGLLRHQGIPFHLHWLTMRLNGMTEPSEYREDMVSILVPDYTVVDKLRTTHLTVHKIK